MGPHDEKYESFFAVIPSTAINQDGRSSSLTAPNGPSQSKLLMNALCSQDIHPTSIAVVVVHGTGKQM
jgi:acyl transferase domain-containing protein